MVWLPDGEKSLKIRKTLSTEYRRVTDRQTSCDSIVRAMNTRRVLKTHDSVNQSQCIEVHAVIVP